MSNQTITQYDERFIVLDGVRVSLGRRVCDYVQSSFAADRRVNAQGYCIVCGCAPSSHDY